MSNLSMSEQEIINIASSDSNLVTLRRRCTLAAEVAPSPPPSHLSPCTPLALENWVKQHAG